MLRSTCEFGSDKENIPPCLDYKLQRVPLSKIIATQYGKQIETQLRLVEKEFSTEDCLASHRITEEHRCKMVDWMCEVLHVFGCSSRTFFLSVRIMDVYFKLQARTIGLEELHVIGVACMFIASKYEDVKPLKLKIIYHKIVNQKLTKSYIRAVEREILEAIQYRISIPTVLDFLEKAIESYPRQVKQTAVLIAELCQVSYEISALSPYVLATTIHKLTQCTFSFSSYSDQLVETLKEFLMTYKWTHHKYVAVLLKHNAKLQPAPGKWFTFM